MRFGAPRKYGNTPVVVDGMRFDSKRESVRYFTLRMRERAGEIRNLRRQVRFELTAHGKRIGYYVADHCYEEDGVEVVEDVKSPATSGLRMFQWKARHFEAEYGKAIRVVS